MNKELLKQFKRWAKHLLKVNPSYVCDPGRLLGFIKGPNWDNPDATYANYRETVKAYGDELLGMFERMRDSNDVENLDEYRELLDASGLLPEKNNVARRYRVRLTRLVNAWIDVVAHNPFEAESKAYVRVSRIPAGCEPWTDDDDVQLEDDTVVMYKGEFQNVKFVPKCFGGESLKEEAE